MAEKKIDQLRAMMGAGDWEKAIKYAAKFPRLGDERDAILSASSAILSPAFYRSLGLDVEATVRRGIEALKLKYGEA